MSQSHASLVEHVHNEEPVIVRIRGTDFIVCAEKEQGFVARPVCNECTEQEYCQPCTQIIAMRFGPMARAVVFVRKRTYQIVAVNGVFITLRRL